MFVCEYFSCLNPCLFPLYLFMNIFYFWQQYSLVEYISIKSYFFSNIKRKFVFFVFIMIDKNNFPIFLYHFFCTFFSSSFRTFSSFSSSSQKRMNVRKSGGFKISTFFQFSPFFSSFFVLSFFYILCSTNFPSRFFSFQIVLKVSFKFFDRKGK